MKFKKYIFILLTAPFFAALPPSMMMFFTLGIPGIFLGLPYTYIGGFIACLILLPVFVVLKCSKFLSRNLAIILSILLCFGWYSSVPYWRHLILRNPGILRGVIDNSFMQLKSWQNAPFATIYISSIFLVHATFLGYFIYWALQEDAKDV